MQCPAVHNHIGSFRDQPARGAYFGASLRRMLRDVAGAAAGAPDDRDRLAAANLGIEDALSIHVYGARHDRLGDEANQIWAD